MYFLGDLTVLATLVDHASKSMPNITATSPEDPGSDENAIAGTIPTPDSGPSESNNQED